MLPILSSSSTKSNYHIYVIWLFSPWASLQPSFKVILSFAVLKLWPCKATIDSFHFKSVTVRFCYTLETLLRLFRLSTRSNVSCVLLSAIHSMSNKKAFFLSFSSKANTIFKAFRLLCNSILAPIGHRCSTTDRALPRPMRKQALRQPSAKSTI